MRRLRTRRRPAPGDREAARQTRRGAPGRARRRRSSTASLRSENGSASEGLATDRPGGQCASSRSVSEVKLPSDLLIFTPPTMTHAVVCPVARRRAPARRLGLGSFVLVVRKLEVESPAVQVEILRRAGRVTSRRTRCASPVDLRQRARASAVRSASRSSRGQSRAASASRHCLDALAGPQTCRVVGPRAGRSPPPSRRRSTRRRWC